jgi:hypothetical protein
MAVSFGAWLDLIDREYLEDFIVSGGAAVKFVVADDDGIAALKAAFEERARARGLIFATVPSAEVKLHMMQDIFFTVARQVDWEADAQRFVETLFHREGYDWPDPGRPTELSRIAAANRVDATLLRREFNKWLTAGLMNDTGMAQDFRIALMQLCLSRLAPADADGSNVPPILEWLRGELRLLGPLKSALIYAKITRHNARAMLRSLCRWLALAGHAGLFLMIDIRRLAIASPAEGVRYTPGAVMDAYEVLRQLIDDADLYERFFALVVADQAFIGDDRKRSIDAYTALKMRIWDDVRARERDNPLAPLAVIAQGDAP